MLRARWRNIWKRPFKSNREIVRNSLSIDYALNTDDSADAVIVEYLDENTWRPADVQYPPNSQSFTATQPSRIRIDGVVNRAQAHREAGFYYLCSQLRRVTATLDTEHDGRMLGFGSRIRVQTELPQTWGYTGIVVSASGNVLTVDPAPTWTPDASHYIAIRNKTGRQFGPVLCTEGADASKIVLDPTDLANVQAAQGTTLADALARRSGAEDPSFDFGPGTSRARDCVVISGRPNGEKVTLSVLIDNRAVHETNLGDTPIPPTTFALKDPTAPIIVGLLAVFRQGIAEPILDVSWFPAAGAQYYNAQVSYDGGGTWSPVYQGTSTQCSVLVEYAALRVRVQGVGKLQGAWSQVDVSAPTIQIRDQAVALQSFQDALKNIVLTAQQEAISNIQEANQQLAALVAEIDSNTQLDKATMVRQIARSAGQVQASFSEAINVAIGPNSALAQQLIELAAQIGNVSASLTTQFIVGVTPSGALARYDLITNAENARAGLSIVASDDGQGGAIGQVWIDADRFFVGKTGVAGFAPIFIVDTSSNPAKIILNGDIVAAGTITADKLNVATLSAITADFGNATFSGVLTSQNGLMVIDFANNQQIFFDNT
jgi:hypothetical protein